MRSRSPAAVTSSRRLARPRTISVSGRPSRRPAQLARPASTSFAGQLVELGAERRLAPLELGARLGERAAAEVRVEVVRRLDQRRRRRAGIEVDEPVLDRAVLADQHDQRPGRLEADELDVLEADVGLAGEHDAGAARQAGERLARLGEDALDGAAGLRRP